MYFSPRSDKTKSRVPPRTCVGKVNDYEGHKLTTASHILFIQDVSQISNDHAVLIYMQCK